MKLTPTWTNVLIGMTSAIFSLCVDLDTPSNVLISCYTLLKIFKGTLNDFFHKRQCNVPLLGSFNFA